MELPERWFVRSDESPDPEFYALPRKLVHIDDGAIAAVTDFYAQLLHPDATVLDLMSSWRSHLPSKHRGPVTGLGLNREEMLDNPALAASVVHDLNARPRLPFDDASFDAVVCCVSVQYMTKPLAVFADVARVLRPGGPFVLTMSNRCFPTKAIAGWLHTSDADHVGMVRRYFEATPGFDAPRAEDRSPGGGDPLYAVWAVLRAT